MDYIMRSPPRHLLRKALRILTASLVGGYLVTCLILYFYQERLLFHPTVVPRDFVYSFAAPFTEVALPVDGATLDLLHFQRPAPKGVVLYLHGNADTIQTDAAVPERFLCRGYDVVLLDYRGYGKSSGAITNEPALHQDVLAVYRYLRQTYRDDQIVLYGYSLGTGLAVQLAAVTSPRMLILEAPYVSMADLVAQKAPYVPLFLLKYPLRSDQWIGQVRCPIYLFHGTQDSLIPYSSSERLRASITAPSELIPLAGGDHGGLATFTAYQEHLDQILR